jgi:hypothetical protein
VKGNVTNLHPKIPARTVAFSISRLTVRRQDLAKLCLSRIVLPRVLMKSYLITVKDMNTHLFEDLTRKIFKKGLFISQIV